MQYTFTSLFQFPGISHQQDEKIVLFSDLAKGIDICFTKNVDEYCLPIDTGLACGSLMLGGAFGAKRIDNFSHDLNEELNRIRKSRAGKIRAGAILAISITGEEALTINEKLHKELENLHVCWDAADKDAIKERHQSFLNEIVTSISAASDHEYGVRRISDGVYFRDENGKPFYSFTGKVGAITVILSKAITSEFVELSLATVPQYLW